MSKINAAILKSCIHCQHDRFENLHTLYAAKNKLTELTLTFRVRKESATSRTGEELEAEVSDCHLKGISRHHSKTNANQTDTVIA